MSRQSQPPDHAFPSLSAIDRERLWAQVKLAGDAVALNWPMRTFVARNPLMGYEHLSFNQAVRRASELMGGQGYLSNDEYRALLTQGRITLGDLRRAIHTMACCDDTAYICIGTRTVRRSEVLLLHLAFGFDPIDPALFDWHMRNSHVTSRFRNDVPEDSQRRATSRLAEPALVSSLWGSTLVVLGCVDPFNADISTRTHRDQSFIPGHSINGDVLDHPKAMAHGHRGETAYHTMGERVNRLTGINIVEQINEQMIKWCAAFLDEGLSDWSMPDRELGFYDAWRAVAQRDFSCWFAGVKRFCQRIRRYPSRPEDAIVGSLLRLGIPEDQWTEYLTRHLTQLPGWAGFVRWRGERTEYVWQVRHPITLVHYLAIRLFYEVELVHVVSQRELACEGTLPALEAYAQNHAAPSDAHVGSNMMVVCRDAWRLFHLFQFLEASPDEVRDMSVEDARLILQWIDAFPSDAHGPVWLAAYEGHYHRELIQMLAARTSTRHADGHHSDVQAAFCIDVRSELLRRHLEAQGKYETIGYAGFFGVPIHYRALAREETLPLCPVLITPKNFAIEVPRLGQPEMTRKFILGSRWHHFGQHLFHALKSHPITSYMLIDVLGALFGLALFGKMVVQNPYRRLMQWLHASMVPRLKAAIPIDKLTDRDIGIAHTRRYGNAAHPLHGDARQRESQEEVFSTYGFTLNEQMRIVETGLRLTGLTRNFARLVLFCGHGSTTDNNPYAAALDCGACGGSHGGPNARVLAAMANRSEVRSALRLRNIDIPDDTWFLAGEHDTTMDRVNLFDCDDAPSTHRRDIQRLTTDLERAGCGVAAERCVRFPDIAGLSDTDDAARHVWGRSGDWSQVRPEWGLSRNAAMIIGKRSLTAGLNLDGRTFLHNYHDDQDESGRALETIMTAPLVVAEWISFQYYFSAVDPWTYGSGSKVIHNVVGGIGVMLGSQSDLQTGFPLQTVNDGSVHYHEPMRLLTIIQAPTERISSIVQRHTVLQQFFDHQWVHLMALDSRGGFHRYQPGGGWESVAREFMDEA